MGVDPRILRSRNHRPTLLFLTVLLVLAAIDAPALRAAEQCSPRGDLARASNILAEVNSSLDSPSCSSAAVQAPSARLSCPHRILDRLSKDQKKGWMKESPSESCLIAGAATKASPAEIESRLARHPSTSLGGRVDGLEQSCGSSLSGVSSEDRKLLAAEFHLDMNRLKQAEVSSHESIAAIDSVLGRKPLQDIPCADSRLPEIDRSCRALQACPASGGLKEQAEEIRQAWPLLVELERRISDGEATRKNQDQGASYGGRLDSRALSEADASVESARRLLSQLKATYPAIDGKEFRKALNPKQGNFEEALTRQLESTRSKLVEESAKYRGAMECLNSPLTCGKCGDYEEVLARAPAR